jgi:hypothetical protein
MNKTSNKSDTHIRKRSQKGKREKTKTREEIPLQLNKRLRE